VDYNDSPDEARFRADLRRFLAETVPQFPAPTTVEERKQTRQRWHQALHAAGYVGVSIPARFGGHGMAPVYEAILNEEVGRSRGPELPRATGYLARALALYGTAEQREAYLDGFISGRALWCQGFSEPDAGSDLASLRTTAISDGDAYVLNGQKVWNGGADYADYCFLLCRTDPGAEKHSGLSVLLIDMKTPGVLARPIRKISGRPDFAEIFFTDARVSASSRLGAEGQGWEIAMSTLSYERGPSDAGFIAKYQSLLEDVDAAFRNGRLRSFPGASRQLARAHVIVEALLRHVQRSLSARDPEVPPGPEASIDKLLMTKTEQELLHIITELTGSHAWLDDDDLQNNYVWSRAASIYGGAEQIQRTIVAQRVLGLPRK